MLACNAEWLAMVKLFKKILVPVDFTEGSIISIRKAIQMAAPFEATICLLYICKPRFSLNVFSSTGYIVAPATEIFTMREIEQKIQHYTSYIGEQLHGVIVQAAISESGKMQRSIEEAANIFGPDLIIIYKKGNKSFFPFFNWVSSEHIAKHTECPVLTFKGGSGEKPIRNIVVPVTYRVPQRKLDIAVKLAKVFNANIHLVSFPDCQMGDENKEHAFIESFKKIRENASLVIRHGPVSGNDIARAILKYSESVQADVILVNPVSESSIHFIVGKMHISDMLPGNSQIQILDIEPYFMAN